MLMVWGRSYPTLLWLTDRKRNLWEPGQFYVLPHPMPISLHLLDLASVVRTEACHRMVAGVFAQLEASMEEVHFERVVASEVQG